MINVINSKPEYYVTAFKLEQGKLKAWCWLVYSIMPHFIHLSGVNKITGVSVTFRRSLKITSISTQKVMI